MPLTAERCRRSWCRRSRRSTATTPRSSSRRITPQTATLKDYEVYSATNAQGANWGREYRYSDVYRLPDFSAKSVDQLTIALIDDKSGEDETSRVYERYFLAGGGTFAALGLQRLWPAYSCSLRELDPAAFRRCMCPASCCAAGTCSSDAVNCYDDSRVVLGETAPDRRMSAAITSGTSGTKLREAVQAEQPLQIVGAINAYHARMAERTGYRAVYLSGGGVAAGSLGMPDLGISTLDDVLIDVRRITDVCSLPLLVDADTGFGGAFNIARTIRSLIKAGAAGCHIEDQVQAKRCGHRPGKQIVPSEEMVDRIKAAVDARTDASFVIMARTDALASEGLQGGFRPRRRLRRGRRRHGFPRGRARA